MVKPQNSSKHLAEPTPCIAHPLLSDGHAVLPFPLTRMRNRRMRTPPLEVATASTAQCAAGKFRRRSQQQSPPSVNERSKSRDIGHPRTHHGLRVRERAIRAPRVASSAAWATTTSRALCNASLLCSAFNMRSEDYDGPPPTKSSRETVYTLAKQGPIRQNNV